ncbi:MAG TPA: type 2 isopentenyl-diphosphate Delta-isomerase [Solirubrobacteraceae bacterium]|nr:type 2 isopentenyl-diphosphate Delta-isomerase [Solirubrobacteraceae bacterium]
MPSDEAGAVEARKAEHLELAARPDVDASSGSAWHDIRFEHEALPELDLDDVDLSVTFLGRRLQAPLVIAGMTGGHHAAKRINATLAAAAARSGLAIGVGSQRAALINPDLSSTYSIVRDLAPSAFLIGNVGIAQLLPQASGPALTLEQLQSAIEMVRADALAIHLNFLEESVQPEGDRRGAGGLEAIKRVASALTIPVVVKETGAGMSRSTALRLAGAGVAALDVGGSGGTSFVAIEGLRAMSRHDEHGRQLADDLRGWGIPTPVSVVAAGPAGLPIIATGGIRSGLDAAKALALGATLVGVARPLLVAAQDGEQAANAWIDSFLHELRTVMFLLGARSPDDLRRTRSVVTGTTRAWLEQLGLERGASKREA